MQIETYSYSCGHWRTNFFIYSTFVYVYIDFDRHGTCHIFVTIIDLASMPFFDICTWLLFILIYMKLDIRSNLFIDIYETWYSWNLVICYWNVIKLVHCVYVLKCDPICSLLVTHMAYTFKLSIAHIVYTQVLIPVMLIFCILIEWICFESFVHEEIGVKLLFHKLMLMEWSSSFQEPIKTFHA